MDIGELLLLARDQQHESSFRLLADCLPQMIWTSTADGACDYLSRRWEDYTGLPVQQQLGTRWHYQVHPEDRVRLMDCWQRSLSTGEALRIDFRIRRYDGVYHWFDTQALPVRDKTGTVVKWFGSHTDIQERIDMREALLHSEQRFRGLYHSAPVSIWLEDWNAALHELQTLHAAGIHDVAQYCMTHPAFVTRMLNAVRVVDVNDWTLRVFRAERKEQLLGSPAWLFATPAAHAGFVQKLIVMAQGERSALLEMELCAVDGSRLHVLSSLVRPSPHGDPGLVLVSRVDITDRYRVEEELHQQRVLLDRMSALAKVGGWGFDVDSGVGMWTDEVARIHGVAPKVAMTPAEVRSLFNDEARRQLESAVQQAVEHATPYDLELPLTTATHAEKWIRTQGIPIIKAGRVVRLEGAIQDITERKRAELALQSLNANLERQVLERTSQLEVARHDLQNILDALPSMVASWDRNLCNRFANRAFLESLGLDVDSIHGKHVSEVFDEALLKDCQKQISLALQGKAQKFEAVINSKDGLRSQRTLVHYLPDVLQGTVQGFYVLISDVTDLKKAEEGLRAANHELEAFAYAVAHDLRAPLRALSGFSQALLEDCASSLTAEAQDFAGEITKASRRMGELLDGLLTLSRSTQGNMQRDFVDLSAMALRLCTELQQQEPGRSVQWQVAPGLHAFGDARMLELVLRNLLGNAWKYTHRVAAATVCFDSVHKRGVRWFRVTDNGAGFDMIHADRLFKPFQRLHRQDEFIGIGIGLATVQRIVHRHGGEITAAATPGQGASFCFSLGDDGKEATDEQVTAAG